MHLGSWRRVPAERNGWLSYREIAPQLADYLSRMGFTHVELLPITEHPFYGSWGYQTTAYFAPTSRYGTPQDFMYFVDHLHQRGIGVILDWVPSHFPADGHGLAYFDGTHLFEHADPRKGFHPDWNSAIFNYGRNEVRSFSHQQRACFGSRNITWTACGSMPWPRCSTWIIPASPADGFPTGTAAGKTSKRLSFCANSTASSPSLIRTC